MDNKHFPPHPFVLVKKELCDGSRQDKNEKRPLPFNHDSTMPDKSSLFPPPRGIQPASPLVGGRIPFFFFFFLWRGERGEGISPFFVFLLQGREEALAHLSTARRMEEEVEKGKEKRPLPSRPTSRFV